MEFQYDGKQSASKILERAMRHSPLDVDQAKSIFIKGNNFDALSSLVVSGFNEKIDLIYIDPPFNTQQEFTVSNDRVSTISRGSKQHVAYKDSMSVQEYIEFIRERLIIMKELLSERGSIYLHIDNKMGHYLKIVLDEVFGISNFKNDISRIKSNPKNFSRNAYGNQKDMILFYAKNPNVNIFNDVRVSLDESDKVRMFQKIDPSGRRYNTVPVHAPGQTANGPTGKEWRGMLPPNGRHWRTNPTELEVMNDKGLIEWSKNGVPRIKKFADEHKGKKMQDIWSYIDPPYPLYPTEKIFKCWKW
jgi:adenine-specific DNA-methyltransferase